eukprot:Nk52_evm59s2657 gene=Nk52_evmTU59s2657
MKGDKKKGKRTNKKKVLPAQAAVKVPEHNVPKNFSTWRAVDDIVLINAVQQVRDIPKIFKTIKFSKKYSLEQLWDRWNALLYDPIVSRRAAVALTKLDSNTLDFLTCRSVLWSPEEEGILKILKPGGTYGISDFEKLLREYKIVFHKTRTAKCLERHWMLLNRFNLLEKNPSEKATPVEKNRSLSIELANKEAIKESFAEFEKKVESGSLSMGKNAAEKKALAEEMTWANRKEKHMIKKAEEEVAASAELAGEMSTKLLAILKGKNKRFKMTEKEVILGRNTSDNVVDFDLNEEGYCMKASRRQAMIKLKSDGDFYLTNIGKRPITVNRTPIIKGEKKKLVNNCVIEIAGLDFVFRINMPLVRKFRHML